MLNLIYKLFTRHCLTCAQAARLFSEGCERRLNIWEKMKLSVLSFMCPYTRRYGEHIRLIHSETAKIAETVQNEPDREGLSRECVDRIRRSLLQQKANETPPSEKAP